MMRLRLVAFSVLVCFLWAFMPQNTAMAQRLFRSDSANFAVFAPDPAFARKVNDEAERFRRELAIEWLGHELPTWREKCPIRVSLSPHSGGETSFAFMTNRTLKGHCLAGQTKAHAQPSNTMWRNKKITRC